MAGNPRRGLKLFNSLTRAPEPFIPSDPNGQRVTWYSCGPTVYDASHMGHARSYISFDILRRVFTQYFGYDVFYVMNVTDIDDKIIRRARQEHLLAEYLKNSPDLRHMISDTTEAIDFYVHETLKTTDPDKQKMREKILTNVKAFITEFENEIQNNVNDVDAHRKSLCEQAKDILYEWLDKKYVEDEGRVQLGNEIFVNFARKWEDEYFQDMGALNIQVPDVLTRVTEYVPEIVTFIVKIIDNGYAYESGGSVYFDTVKYAGSGNHTYGKLVPEAVGNLQALQEGEGELSNSKQDEKKSPADFALWKSSKVGEPSWDSPWGKGRPGWHIECSAMASAIIGETMDIHTGGVDLKFPHHDNELAQSEAFFENDSWVRFFLHSGHLTISGCKMSKSLKNFITIKDALQQYTSTQLRLTFLMHSWKDTLDYSPSGMQTAIQVEKQIQEFFLNVKDCLRSSNKFPKWTMEDLKFSNSLSLVKRGVHTALCDNIDTRSVMFVLKDLIGEANVYIQGHKSNKVPVNGPLLKSAAVFISRILRIFGVISSSEEDSFGFRKQEEGTGAAVDTEEIILPFVEVLSDFREKVRTTARSIENPTIKTSILNECDLVRDEKLPALGVRLEDHEGCPSVVKYVGKDVMAQERQLREKMEEELRLEKEKKKEEQLRAQLERDAQRRIPPSEMFKLPGEMEKYGGFDDKGMPTHDAEGNPLTKSSLKKLEKLFKAQEKKYSDFIASSTTT